jgi:hypothetical protein
VVATSHARDGEVDARSYVWLNSHTRRLGP